MYYKKNSKENSKENFEETTNFIIILRIENIVLKYPTNFEYPIKKYFFF
jgi:hypothetical protein